MNKSTPALFLYFSTYLILAYVVIKGARGIKIPEISGFMILVFSVPAILLLSLLYCALFFVFDAADNNHFGLTSVYSVVFAFLNIAILTYYILKNNTTGFFVLTAVFCLVLSGLFHILHNFYAQFHFFVIINAFCQIISFYFVVKYFLYRSHYNFVLRHDEE